MCLYSKVAATCTCIKSSYVTATSLIILLFYYSLLVARPEVHGAQNMHSSCCFIIINLKCLWQELLNMRLISSVLSGNNLLRCFSLTLVRLACFIPAADSWSYETRYLETQRFKTLLQGVAFERCCLFGFTCYSWTASWTGRVTRKL